KISLLSARFKKCNGTGQQKKTTKFRSYFTTAKMRRKGMYIPPYL
ncbi:MAG: hypothetical protein ACI9JY_003323, partial [Saprospiraceae bacterium]